MNSPRDIVGMAFQNPVLLEWRSILKNVMLPLEIVPNDLSSVAREQRALDLLKLVGLAGFEDKKPSELSGGMRQRASLCRALVRQTGNTDENLEPWTPLLEKICGRPCINCGNRNHLRAF